MGKLFKAAAIGAAVYAIGKVGETIGFVKGAVASIKLAYRDPAWAANQGKRWEGIDQDWQDLKNKKA